MKMRSAIDVDLADGATRRIASRINTDAIRALFDKIPIETYGWRILAEATTRAQLKLPDRRHRKGLPAPVQAACCNGRTARSQPSKETPVRTFIALELPPRFADEVDGMARQLALIVDGRFMPRENHHLTLAFLGDVCEAEAAKAVAVVEKACARAAGPVPLRCVGLGSFGKPTDATLWLGVDADPTLLDLVRSVRDGLDDAGIAYDTKPFKPHITLARRARLPRGTSLPALPFPNTDQAATVTLFKSTLGSEGASYKPLFSAGLR